jgi:N-acetyltransferase 10
LTTFCDVSDREIPFPYAIPNFDGNFQEQMRAKNEGMLDPELLQQYAINDIDDELGNALKKGGNASASGLVSIKSNKTPADSKHKKRQHKDSGHSSKRKGKLGDKSSSKKRIMSSSD